MKKFYIINVQWTVLNARRILVTSVALEYSKIASRNR